MSFPLTFAAVIVLAVAFFGLLSLIATAGDRKYSAKRRATAVATPPHYQGRAADFDEYGRPW